LNFAIAGVNKWSLYRPGSSADLRLFDNATAIDVMTWQVGGNVGIGTSSPAYKLQLNSASAVDIETGVSNSAGLSRYGTRSSGNAFLGAFTAGKSLELWAAGSQAATLDSSGNLGLGVTPTTKLDVQTSSGRFQVDALGGASAQIISSGAMGYKAATGNGHLFFLDTTQAMTLDASGNLVVGVTSSVAAPANGFCTQNITGATQFNIGHGNGTGSGTAYLSFAYNAGTIGSITQNGTTGVLYNIMSDQRAKENIQNAAPASSLIDAIQVRQYDWKSDGSHQRYGFIAQELVAVAPEAVHQPVNPDEMMGVDYSKLVPILVKEIQSLRQRVAQLEGK
jgi:hypothetical protein